MGSLTNTAETEVLDHVINNLAYSSPTAVYLGLCTADPTDAATGGSANEAADANAYARVAISFDASSSRVITQDADVNFPQASGGGWGDITHWAIFTSITYGAGDCLAHGAFVATKTINDQDQPSVASGVINVTFTADEWSDHIADEILDHLFDNASYTYVATYLALIITNPVTAGMTGSTITEPSGGSYARKQVLSSAWDAAVSGDPSYVDNTAEIPFVTATANWGTVIALAVVDASSNGNLLFFDNTMTDKAVNDGDTAKFAAGVLDIQLS